MSTVANVDPAREPISHSLARPTGAVYLSYFLTAIVAALFVSRGFVTYGNAANLIANALYIAVNLLFFRMFAPVSRSLSSVAAVVGFAGCVVQTLALFHRPAHLNAFLFFGSYCVLLGYLICRSTFLPRPLGVLVALAGFGWLTVLAPPIAIHTSPYVEVLGVLAEGALMFRLLVVGVNERAWSAMAST